MKRIYFAFGIVATAFIFSYCSTHKKVAEVDPVAAVKTTFQSDILSVVTTSCTPCHVPSAGGKKKPYDNFSNVKADIDDIIHRISLNPTDRGFMPMRGTEKLPDSVIAKFVKWKADGMLEN